MKAVYALLPLLLAACSGNAVRFAEPEPAETPAPAFTESVQDLPEVPAAQDARWYPLHIDNAFRGKPRILLDSVHYAKDGSVRYVLDAAAASGYPNISAEGMFCMESSSLLQNSSVQMKTFGYADLHNKRWISPRRPQWQQHNSQDLVNDPVRRLLYDAFCLDGKSANDQELRERVRQAGSTSNKPDYGR